MNLTAKNKRVLDITHLLDLRHYESMSKRSYKELEKELYGQSLKQLKNLINS